MAAFTAPPTSTVGIAERQQLKLLFLKLVIQLAAAAGAAYSTNERSKLTAWVA
jgi:hypothetical protein